MFISASISIFFGKYLSIDQVSFLERFCYCSNIIDNWHSDFFNFALDKFKINDKNWQNPFKNDKNSNKLLYFCLVDIT